jgi:predicted transcriptional regulator
MRIAHLGTFLILATAAACYADLKPTTLPKPLPAKATLAGTFENVAGDLVRYDAESFVLKTDKGDRSIKWATLTRLSHYGLRKQLVDPDSAADWRDLAQLATKLDMREEAAAAMAKAEQGDPFKQVKRDILASTTATPRPSTVATTQRARLKPMTVTVTLSTETDKVTGELLAYDAEWLVIKDAKGEQKRLKWTFLAPLSRYTLRAQLIDKTRAADWLELAEVAVKCNLIEQAKVNVANAARLDPSTRVKGDAILRTGAEAVFFKYQRATPEEHAKAIEVSRQIGTAVGEHLGLRLDETQSAHFIIFTDWPSGEYEFLRKQCEAAYAAVSKQFDIPVEENVFVGKLLIFMFARREDYNRFGTTIDKIPGDSIASFLGHYAPHLDGTGHMAMPHPDARDVKNAETAWAYTLTHEFTHAFVARYRTNRPVPRWLNEGMAEWIAYQRFPRKNVHAFARAAADYRIPLDFANLFDDKKFPGGEMYPVMQTMVEALINEDRKAFIQMFNNIKDGMKPEEALRRSYRATYKDWEPAWRNYARKLKD